MPHPDGRAATMAQHIVAVLAARCDPVFVVAAPGQTLPNVTPAVVLRDTTPGLGPLPATAQGLRAAAAAGCDRAFVCAVDMPGLVAGIVDELQAYRDAELVLPWDGRDHYLAAIYRTSLAGRIEELVAAGERRMRALADAVSTRRVTLSDALTGVLENMNTPAGPR